VDGRRPYALATWATNLTGSTVRRLLYSILYKHVRARARIFEARDLGRSLRPRPIDPEQGAGKAASPTWRSLLALVGASHRSSDRGNAPVKALRPESPTRRRSRHGPASSSTEPIAAGLCMVVGGGCLARCASHTAAIAQPVSRTEPIPIETAPKRGTRFTRTPPRSRVRGARQAVSVNRESPRESIALADGGLEHGNAVPGKRGDRPNPCG